MPASTHTFTPFAPESFPLLRSAAAKWHAAQGPERLGLALQTINDGYASGSIRNVALQREVKDTLGRIVEKAWDIHVRDPFFFQRSNDHVSEDEKSLFWNICIMSLHDVIAAAKRIDRCSLQTPALVAMRAFVSEALPLAQAVAGLKDKVVKGRRPRTDQERAQTANPNKVMGSCACCLRSIAVLPTGNMAHHGYRRPNLGFQTASCPGIRFRPLEVSTEGLEWLLKLTRESVVKYERVLDRREEITRVMVSAPSARRAAPAPLKHISRGEPGWERAYQAHINQLKYELSSAQGQERYLSEHLARWQDWHAQNKQAEADGQGLTGQAARRERGPGGG